MKERQSIVLDNLYNIVKYYYYDIWNIYGDPRVTDYPFMDGGPWSTLALICLYLYLVKFLGPTMMKSRSPYDMRNLILFYNISLVIVNGWLFWKGSWITNFGLDSWKCQVVDRTSTSSIDLYKIKLGWLFYLTKTIDFCDTFFFVLRKKDRQVSGLHVFHHSCMPFFCWIGLKFTPGGNNAFFPWLNSGVHTVMYAYYAASTFHYLRPYLWWKKYITQMQMIQFIAVIVHSFYSMSLPGCEWPKMFIYLSIFNAFLFFCMFYSFFQKTYKQQQSDRRAAEVAASINNGKLSTGSMAINGNTIRRKLATNHDDNDELIVKSRIHNLDNLLQACKPDHVNHYNDDDNVKDDHFIYSSSSTDDRKKINNCNNSQDKDIHLARGHDTDLINNITNSSTITRTRSFCSDSKCVKCK